MQGPQQEMITSPAPSLTQLPPASRVLMCVHVCVHMCVHVCVYMCALSSMHSRPSVVLRVRHRPPASHCLLASVCLSGFCPLSSREGCRSDIYSVDTRRVQAVPGVSSLWPSLLLSGTSWCGWAVTP